jgi:hypothetical protein
MFTGLTVATILPMQGMHGAAELCCWLQLRGVSDYCRVSTGLLPTSDSENRNSGCLVNKTLRVNKYQQVSVSIIKSQVPPKMELRKQTIIYII